MIVRINTVDSKVFLEPETKFETDYIVSLRRDGYLVGHIEEIGPPDNRTPIIMLEIKK